MKPKLPLLWKTPAHWAREVLEDPDALLSDHAYLERKAASNALELFNRWPAPAAPGDWPGVLAQVARDETRHMEMVIRLLRARGSSLQRLHRNDYANALRGLVRAGQAEKELLDRLLVSALIEARSCERFVLLAGAAEGELKRLYKILAVSESGHYRVFLDLAARVGEASEAAARWKHMRTAEAQVIQSQPPGPRIHSGCKNLE